MVYAEPLSMSVSLKVFSSHDAITRYTTLGSFSFGKFTTEIDMTVETRFSMLKTLDNDEWKEETL